MFFWNFYHKLPIVPSIGTNYIITIIPHLYAYITNMHRKGTHLYMCTCTAYFPKWAHCLMWKSANRLIERSLDRLIGHPIGWPPLLILETSQWAVYDEPNYRLYRTRCAKKIQCFFYAQVWVTLTHYINSGDAWSYKNYVIWLGRPVANVQLWSWYSAL